MMPSLCLSAEPAWAPPDGTLQDVGLRVRSLGTGAPTILLLHGLVGSNRYFGAAFDALQQDGRVVAPDLLGFGDSPRPGDVDYGPDAQATALIGALERLDIEPPIYVAAHSAGALVALRLAALRPDWVRGIVAFGPPLYPSEAAARAHIAAQGGLVRLFAMDTLWAELACRLMHPFANLGVRLASRVRPELPPPIAEDVVKHSWASYAGTVRNLILRAQPPPDLPKLQIPVWLVIGTDDEVVDFEFLKILDDAHEAVRLELWQGGHDLPLTDASRAVETIRALVAADAAPLAHPKDRR